MPVEIKPLSQQEKEDIIIKHHEIIDEFNRDLPDELKIPYDKQLPLRLEDPNEVKYYRTVMQIQQRINRQNEIMDDFKRRFGPLKNPVLIRSFIYGLKPETDPETIAYNERIYQEYQKNPDKIIYQRMHKVLEFNPNELIKCLDDKQKMVEFYLKNQRLCEDAFVFKSALDNPESQLNPTLRENFGKMAKLVETLSFPATVARRDAESGYFAFPGHMNQEQALTLMGTNPAHFNDAATYRRALLDKVSGQEGFGNPREFYQRLKQNNIHMGPDFFLRYRAQEVNPNNQTTTDLNLYDGLERANEPNVTVIQRSNEEIMEMKKINTEYDKEYCRVFQRRFSRNFDGQPFDFNRLKEAHKGNVVERFLGKTSPEYREFIDAFEKFNDPKSTGFLYKERLRNACNAYNDHKAEQGISLNNMDKTSKARMKFVNAVLATLDQVEADPRGMRNEIENNLKEDDFYREPFLSEEEVNENAFDNNVSVDELNRTLEDDEISMNN